ncbi:uncharacterized protein MONBRDRAFT_11221, partial [Monosiga brevicollis MX1]
MAAIELPHHAGTTRQDIVAFTHQVIETARGVPDQQVWAFYDEVNTCEYLGLLTDILVRRKLYTDPLPENLIVMGACNPYERRAPPVRRAGLAVESKRQGRVVQTFDERSQLRYRVHPLPEAMLTYVWDFGALAEADEANYIERMLMQHVQLRDPGQLAALAHGLSRLHTFLRQDGRSEEFVVSLRDVRRFLVFYKFFQDYIARRDSLDPPSSHADSRWNPFSQNFGASNRLHALHGQREAHSVVLSIQLAYIVRMPVTEERRMARETLLRCVQGSLLPSNFGIKSWRQVVNAEERNLYGRMDTSAYPNLAMNRALLQNVFSLTVCVLTRTPIILIGAPGNSKTVATTIVNCSL